MTPDPEKWKALQQEIDYLWRNDPPWYDEIVELSEAVARRRAIEELKAIVPDVCTYCRRGLPSRRVEQGVFGTIQHDLSGGNWSPHAWCDAAWLHNRIAEIEAEEA